MLKFIIIVLIQITLLLSSSYAYITKAKLYVLDQNLRQIINPVSSKAGLCFIDLESGAELQINGHKKFPAASVAKLAVMTTAYHLGESGKINLDQKVKLRKKDKLPGSGILRWLGIGQEYSLRNLIRLMITQSDNTATKMVIDRMGLISINDYMTKLKFTNTRIIDNTMLREPPHEYVNYTTPEDMARLVAKFKDTKYFSARSAEQMLSYMREQKYRWGLWQGVPKGIKVANKTGTLTGILNDVGLVYSPFGNYVLAVFTHGFSDKNNARKFINQVSKTVYQAYL